VKGNHIKLGTERVWMHKSIINVDFQTESVLSNNPWLFVELWLQRKGHKEALPFWRQAHRFAEASSHLSVEAAPLTLYYSFLNATKALLKVRGAPHADVHGVSGNRPESAKSSLENETVFFKAGGVLPALCLYLGESATEHRYSLKTLLWNLPFVHRAFLHTYTSMPDLFIPLESACYVHKQNSSEAWFQATVVNRYADGRKLSNLPASLEWFEGDDGFTYIRRIKRFRWYTGRVDSEGKKKALDRLQNYHSTTRRVIVPISGNRDLWYVRRANSQNTLSGRHPLSIMFATMHRLSELARYDPKGLQSHLDGKANWLLAEFIEHAPIQFLDQIASEITGLRFWRPAVRT